MTRSFQIVVFASVFLMLMLALLLNSQKSTQSLIPSHQLSVPMLVLHAPEINAPKAYSQALSDKYLFLLLKEHNQLFFFTSLEQLRVHDGNKDNIIDNADAIFNKLYLGVYDKKLKTMVYHPFTKTAIRAIQINPSYAQVIFSDNHLAKHLNPLTITQERFFSDELQQMKTQQKS